MRWPVCSACRPTACQLQKQPCNSSWLRPWHSVLEARRAKASPPIALLLLRDQSSLAPEICTSSFQWPTFCLYSASNFSGLLSATVS